MDEVISGMGTAAILANDQDGTGGYGFQVLGQCLDRYGNGTGDVAFFEFFPRTDVDNGQVVVLPDRLHGFRWRQGAGMRHGGRCAIWICPGRMCTCRQCKKEEAEEDLKPQFDWKRSHGFRGHGKRCHVAS